MTTIATGFNVYDAQRLQLALAAAGISSIIPDELSAYHLLISSGVRLQVADAAVEEARRIVAGEEASW